MRRRASGSRSRRCDGSTARSVSTGICRCRSRTGARGSCHRAPRRRRARQGHSRGYPVAGSIARSRVHAASYRGRRAIVPFETREDPEGSPMLSRSTSTMSRGRHGHERAVVAHQGGEERVALNLPRQRVGRGVLDALEVGARSENTVSPRRSAPGPHALSSTARLKPTSSGRSRSTSAESPDRRHRWAGSSGPRFRPAMRRWEDSG